MVRIRIPIDSDGTCWSLHQESFIANTAFTPLRAPRGQSLWSANQGRCWSQGFSSLMTGFRQLKPRVQAALSGSWLGVGLAAEVREEHGRSLSARWGEPWGAGGAMLHPTSGQLGGVDDIWLRPGQVSKMESPTRGSVVGQSSGRFVLQAPSAPDLLCQR